MAPTPTLRCALLALLAAFAAPAPGGAEEETLTFAVVGHLRGDATGEPNPFLDAIVDAVAAARPDLVFLAGDLVWGDYNDAGANRAAIVADWERLDAALARLGVPVHRVPGNHDVNDPVTRDVWLERYGPLPRAVRHDGTLFLLLASGPFPEGDAPPPVPRPASFTRPAALAAAQREFLRRELEAGGYEHAFVFLHHVLWWEDDAPWWRDVHPLLAAHRVRAVFGGDYGPLKFSHVRRDGVDYVQTAVEGRADDLAMLRALETSRRLSFQLDNFIVVTVRGDDVAFDVRTVGALASGKLSPERYRAIYAPASRSLRERVERTLGGPERRAALAALLAAAFGLGWLLGRRRARR
jgi:hypothetical protein